MTAFYDSSALVKWYVPEHGWQGIRQLTGPILCSSLAQVEVTSALWRKSRMNELSSADATILSAAMSADLASGDIRGRAVIALPVETSVLSAACLLVERHGLRAYDAIQLATALVVRDILKRDIDFASFDRALLTAAEAEGLRGIGL